MADGLPSLSTLLDTVTTSPSNQTSIDLANDPLAFGGPGVSMDREDQFDRASGRFHDPDSGRFEPGSPPPDLDTSVDRYRATDGQFKAQSADLYDEPQEELLDSLEPRG